MKRSPQSTISRNLSYQEVYTCPICRHGEIAGMTLMDAFACNFCRHIFTANLREQSVQVVDNSHPLAWRWNGQAWRGLHQVDGDQTVLIWLIGLILVVLPSALVGLASYMFPPLDDSPSNSVPLLWTSLTFCLHFILVAWLVAEHHQFPLYVACKVRLQGLTNRS
ncbi:hypothetical protein NDA01_12440 [Trichocoleus desertorum AS-A10]|uniref:hypothetical protein n=1 Tax=Trichocoleus desertorum TaxID=1481672 RepID=UPI003298F9A6